MPEHTMGWLDADDSADRFVSVRSGGIFLCLETTYRDEPSPIVCAHSGAGYGPSIVQTVNTDNESVEAMGDP